MYAFALFAFVHILLRPGTGYVADTKESPTVVVVGLFILFGLFSLAFWAYFQFRSPRARTNTMQRIGGLAGSGRVEGKIRIVSTSRSHLGGILIPST